MLIFDEDRLRRIALSRFADRLYAFVCAHVKPPRPVEYELLRRAVLNQHGRAAAYGFAAEADYALYILAAFCFPDEFREGWISFLLNNKQLSMDSKRHQISEAMDRLRYLPYGSLLASE